MEQVIIHWVPISFQDYIEKSDWQQFDAIMMTHAFSDYYPVHNLLDVMDESGVYAKFYPEVCKEFEDTLKFATHKLTIEDFYQALMMKYYILPLMKISEDILISSHLIVEGTHLMSNLSKCWKNESVIK